MLSYGGRRALFAFGGVSKILAMSNSVDGVVGSTRSQPSTERERFAAIFFPSAYEQIRRVRAAGTRFVHYTSAEAALSIIRGKEVWLRESACMNDFLEVHYGLTRLSEAYQRSEAGKKFQSALDSIFQGISAEIAQHFDSWVPHFPADTYFFCVSEHDDAEDQCGRLSMWRAYGQPGVALVLNNSVFLNPADGFGAYVTPVSYFNGEQFGQQLSQVADNIKTEAELIQKEGRETTMARVFQMLVTSSISTKHPGFAEEKEWRVYYCPSLENSKYLKKRSACF
jgi:hypothetical protein